MLYPAVVSTIFLTELFILCYFGDRVTQSFEEIGESIYQQVWYLYPIEVRRKLPSIISVAQIPLYVTAFSVISCTLEYFKVVSKGRR